MPAEQAEKGQAAPAEQHALVDDDEDDWSDDENEYMLGYVNEAAPAALLRHRFPSKVGGRPAWLDPVHLPTAEQLTCKATGKPLNFLLQLYAPPPDEVFHEAAFHRALFMFVTPEGQSIHEPGAVRTYRCQIPRRNPFYNFDPPSSLLPQPLQLSEQEASLQADPWQVLAAEAALAQPSKSKGKGKGKGGKSSKAAGSTPSAAGECVQAADAVVSRPPASAGSEAPTVTQGEAAAGGSQPASTGGAAAGAGCAASQGNGMPTEQADLPAASTVSAAAEGLQGLSLAAESGSNTQPVPGRAGGVVAAGRAAPKAVLQLFPELELQCYPEERETEEEQALVQKLLSEYEARVAEDGELGEEELPGEVVEQVEDAHTREQKHFAMFQARVEPSPDQVVRYCFQLGARPLWPSPDHQPTPADIPPCPHCNQPRRFEFQVMPQLLNELDQDELSESALDWGTIAVYSCPTSCEAGTKAAMQQGSAYVEEFVWVQPAM